MDNEDENIETNQNQSNPDENIETDQNHSNPDKATQTQTPEISKPPVTPNIEEYNSKRAYIREDMLTATSTLQLRADAIRSNKINWAASNEAQDLSSQDKDFITKLDSDEGKKQLPDKSPEQVTQVLVGLLGTGKPSLLQYVLVMIDDIMSEDKTRVNLFENKNALAAFLNGLQSNDLFAEHMSGRIIAKLACWLKQPLGKDVREAYFNWIKKRLTTEMTTEGRSEYLNSAVRCLQMILRRDAYRYSFTKFEGIPMLLNLLTAKINFQVQYQVVFCLWVFTFNPDLAGKVTQYPQFVPLLAETLSVSGKEKVTRILLAVFRNIIEKPKDDKIVKENCIALLQSKVLKLLYIVELKSSDDEDFMNDLDFLINRLLASERALSSFDQYVAEVKSGRLEWSPVHKSVQFWRENAIHIHEQPQLLQTIVDLLKTSRDPVVLTVACYDVGEYVRHYPRGKHDMDQFGGKQNVMALLQHEDTNVRFEALLALQKMMVQNWEYLGKQLEKDQYTEKGKKNSDAKDLTESKDDKEAEKRNST